MHDAPHPRDYSALIIGGGPAGLATALALAHYDIATIVVERSAYDDVRIGEHLAPAGVLQLKGLDPGFSALAVSHGESAGVTAYWGSARANHTDYFLHPGQHGLNLSRPRFDTDLARAAESSGVTVLRSASLKRALRAKAGWLVDIDLNGSTLRLGVLFIVDAAGRLAKFSRQQGSMILANDRQLAVVAFRNCSSEADWSTRSIVEAVENGWWYCSYLNATRSVCMFITDSDLLPRGGARNLYGWWVQQLGQTHYIPRQFQDVAHFVIRSARSQCLDVPFGLGWLAVGDAAMALDPLASQGIAKALDHGARAAASISAYLKGDESSPERFAVHLFREYAAFQSTRTQYYGLEQRWPRSIFWRRRNTLTKQGALSALTPGA